MPGCMFLKQELFIKEKSALGKKIDLIWSPYRAAKRFEIINKNFHTTIVDTGYLD